MFRMDHIHTWDNSQRVSGAELESTARYRVLLFAQIGAGCRYSHRNKPRGLLQTRKKIKRVGVLVYPTETLGDLKVKSQELWPRDTLSIINMGTISVSTSFSHPGISCLIIMIIP